VQNERPDIDKLTEEFSEEPRKAAELVISLLDRCEKLEERVRSLESNSRNSSKPPSSDIGKPKPQSQRKKSGKKQGGQPGHKGSTLELTDNPDLVVINEFDPESVCRNCGAPISADEHNCEHEVRQVIDLPAIRLETTEYRSPKIVCSECGVINTAPFPQEVKARVQPSGTI